MIRIFLSILLGSLSLFLFMKYYQSKNNTNKPKVGKSCVHDDKNANKGEYIRENKNIICGYNIEKPCKKSYILHNGYCELKSVVKKEKEKEEKEMKEFEKKLKEDERREKEETARLEREAKEEQERLDREIKEAEEAAKKAEEAAKQAEKTAIIEAQKLKDEAEKKIQPCWTSWSPSPCIGGRQIRENKCAGKNWEGDYPTEQRPCPIKACGDYLRQETCPSECTWHKLKFAKYSLCVDPKTVQREDSCKGLAWSRQLFDTCLKNGYSTGRFTA